MFKSYSLILVGHFYRLIWESFPIQKRPLTFPISCILVLIFPIFMIYFPKCEGKGSLPKSKIQALILHEQVSLAAVNHICVIHEFMNGCKNLKIH